MQSTFCSAKRTKKCDQNDRNRKRERERERVRENQVTCITQRILNNELNFPPFLSLSPSLCLSFFDCFTRQLISILDATLGKISRYDEGNILAPILSITVSVICLSLSLSGSFACVTFDLGNKLRTLLTICCDLAIMRVYSFYHFTVTLFAT